MPNLSFPEPAADGPFDLDAADSAVGNAIIGMLKMMMREPGSKPDPTEAKAVMDGIRQGLMAGSQACTEITRIRAELAALRDEHRPRPHADSAQPGALCTACSVHGSIVIWPCGTWSAAERILTRGKA
ncbi:hypothetical protein ACF1BS_04400 [Streptomyces sp. NPDC014748]|uniref:hypothetical protein n=1 Tax=Streptomyces sp. NPDC014748 TaxID=3364905 RepID=UPI0036FD8546